MWPDRVSNPGPLSYESGALPTALRGPALTYVHWQTCICKFAYRVQKQFVLSVHMPEYRGIETRGHSSCFSIFHLFFFLSPTYKLTLQISVRVFSGKFS